MWYELIAIAVFGLLCVLLGVYSFRLGMQYGVNVFLAGYEAKTGKKVVVNEVAKKPRKKADKTETDEQRKRNILMANINAFDGSTLGQMEIK